MSTCCCCLVCGNSLNLSYAVGVWELPENFSGNFHEGFHARAGGQQSTEGLHQNPSELQTGEGRGGSRDASQCLREAGLHLPSSQGSPGHE